MVSSLTAAAPSGGGRPVAMGHGGPQVLVDVAGVRGLLSGVRLLHQGLSGQVHVLVDVMLLARRHRVLITDLVADLDVDLVSVATVARDLDAHVVAPELPRSDDGFRYLLEVLLAVGGRVV